jgi:hypothetical protein
MNDVKESIESLIPYLEYAASEDTAYCDDYRPENGILHNHCGCVAYVIQKMYGGELMGAKNHIWNRIEDIEYDATKDDLIPSYNGHKLPERKTINPRFKIFDERVTNQLHEKS